MKDEHLARIEALKLTQMVGGISSQKARIEIASQFEHYILNGLPGEAPKPSPAPDAGEDNVVPVTAAKGRRSGRTKASSEVPASTGEASDETEEGETDPSLLGRPSSRVAGVSV